VGEKINDILVFGNRASSSDSQAGSTPPDEGVHLESMSVPAEDPGEQLIANLLISLIACYLGSADLAASSSHQTCRPSPGSMRALTQAPRYGQFAGRY
jgi:hypothetical protein